VADSAAREPSGNLPVEMTSFVGRRQEIAEVKRLLARSRLVTLTGAGGVGKTRLAVRVAGQLRRAFPDGVWLVSLADLSDPALLPATVATVLGVQDYSAQGLMAAVCEFLRGRHLLLVMDNCEHLVDACAGFVGGGVAGGAEGTGAGDRQAVPGDGCRAVLAGACAADTRPSRTAGWGA